MTAVLTIIQSRLVRAALCQYLGAGKDTDLDIYPSFGSWRYICYVYLHDHPDSSSVEAQKSERRVSSRSSSACYLARRAKLVCVRYERRRRKSSLGWVASLHICGCKQLALSSSKCECLRLSFFGF